MTPLLRCLGRLDGYLADPQCNTSGGEFFNRRTALCQPCAAGMFLESWGTTSLLDDTPSLGPSVTHTTSPTRCISCKMLGDDAYQPSTGQTSCLHCKAGMKLRLNSRRTIGTDCRCEKDFFSHTASPNQHGMHVCINCLQLGKSGPDLFAKCKGHDESSDGGELYAPVARAGYYGVRWLVAGGVQYAFHPCSPSTLCLGVDRYVLVANTTAHSFSSLSFSLSLYYNPISRFNIQPH